MMVAIRRMLTWWEQGDAGKVIAQDRRATSDQDFQDLKSAHQALDRRVDLLAKEIATQRRERNVDGQSHTV